MDSEKSLENFKVGDRARIKPEWQDEGDDEFERVARTPALTSSG